MVQSFLTKPLKKVWIAGVHACLLQLDRTAEYGCVDLS